MSSIVPRRRKRRGPGRPPRSESRHTRTEIMASAKHHFSETGFHATSLRQIATTANVDLATVKYHYEDKLELYNAAFLQGHTRLVEHLIPQVNRLHDAKNKDDLLDIIRDFTRTSVELVETNEAFVRLLLFRMLEDIDYPQEIREAYSDDVKNALALRPAPADPPEFMKNVDVHALIMMLSFSIPLLVLSAESYRRLATPLLTDIHSDSAAGPSNSVSNGGAPLSDTFSAQGVETLALKVMDTLLVASPD